MEKTAGMRLWVLIVGLLGLAACGVDGAPVPPGQENPESIQSVDDLNQSAYL